MRSLLTLITATTAFMLSLGAFAQAPSEELVPEPVKRLPHAFVTADELANPDLYYPRYDFEYAPPMMDMLPPPPDNDVVRPGEFEPMDSSIIAIVNYGSEFLNMWVEMVEAYSTAGHTYIAIDSSLVSYMTGRFDDSGLDSYDYTMFTESDGYALNSIWIRDFGPEFAREDDGTRHIFDADYSHRPLDDVIPQTMGADDWLNADGSAVPVHTVDHMLSGGNIFTDGDGTCFFSNIVYGYEKPSGWTNDDVDALMRDYLGCEQMIVLNPICLDGTGHIDLYAKGMGRHSILLGQYPADTYFDGTQSSGETYGYCSTPGTPNDYQDQEDNLAILEASTNLDGEPWEITRMPMLEPYMDGGYWVYRSYMNSELFNGMVAMPSYYAPQGDETVDYLLEKEAEAIAAYEAAAPNGIEVFPIDSDHIIPLAGAIHCITHEIPAESDYAYTEPGDTDSDTDTDSDSDSDSDADGDSDSSGDDGCGCTVTGRTVTGSWISLLF